MIQNKKEITRLIKQALQEDACRHDQTTRTFINAQAWSEGVILFRENAVVCGVDIVKQVFQTLDPGIKVKNLHKDGNPVKSGENVIYLKGRTRALLSAERVALNFLSHLSAVATETGKYVKAVKGTKAVILDTRKTTPGLRLLEKYAVKRGGGENHRFDLSGMYFIKDNHLSTLKNRSALKAIISKIKQREKKTIIEIEVENLNQFKEILELKADIILLDNMSIQQIKKAVNYLKKLKLKTKPLLEVSGGVNLKNIKNIARTGVDRISIGALTHSVKSIDVSLEFIKP